MIRNLVFFAFNNAKNSSKSRLIASEYLASHVFADHHALGARELQPLPEIELFGLLEAPTDVNDAFHLHHGTRPWVRSKRPAATRAAQRPRRRPCCGRSAQVRSRTTRASRSATSNAIA